MMEEKRYNILFVEDHPLILDGYKKALWVLKKNKPNWHFEYEEANSCDTAMGILNKNEVQKVWDLVFLDLKIPPSQGGKFLSGEDIGLQVRKRQPSAKIVIATTFDNPFRIQTIFKNINPEGFLIKNESTASVLVEAISTIIEGKPYYSPGVVQVLRQNLANNFLVDDLDRKLLYELSIGTNTSNLPKILPLSLATVERRKKHLKEIFDVEGDDDRELLERARELGFI